MENYFIYEKIKYPRREIRLPEFGHVTISVMSLSNAIINDNGKYPSIEAQNIDEQIFFFVEDHKINLPNLALRIYIMDAVL